MKRHRRILAVAAGLALTGALANCGSGERRAYMTLDGKPCPKPWEALTAIDLTGRQIVLAGGLTRTVQDVQPQPGRKVRVRLMPVSWGTDSHPYEDVQADVLWCVVPR